MSAFAISLLPALLCLRIFNCLLPSKLICCSLLKLYTISFFISYVLSNPSCIGVSHRDLLFALRPRGFDLETLIPQIVCKVILPMVFRLILHCFHYKFLKGLSYAFFRLCIDVIYPNSFVLLR